MPHVPLRYAPPLFFHSIKNFLSNKPLVLSFEVTLSCNANCKHCDLGGGIRGEERIPPEAYRSLIEQYHPAVVQLSGGEPLLRKDLKEIARAIKINPYFPYTILVTNGWVLTKEKYLELKENGVNQFSVSLDFPDSRHDEFRGIKGLFERLNRTLPELASMGFGDIVLNTAITSANLRELAAIAETAKRWGVYLSFSIYTPLRTGNNDFAVSKREDIEFAAEIFEKCKKEVPPFEVVINSSSNLDGLLHFMQNGEIPGCTAGKRFMVVKPDGLLNPCSLHRIDFASQAEMLEGFTKKNECGGCFVSIRSYVELPFGKLVWENLSMRVLRSNG